jgi:uncharacterized protein
MEWACRASVDGLAFGFQMTSTLLLAGWHNAGEGAIAAVREGREGVEYANTVASVLPLPGFPMTISMYQASVPRFVNSLGNLSNILDKAQAYVDAKKLDPTALTTFRLFPDMLPMTKQVQLACDTAKGVVARLGGVEIPVHEDNEKTLAELKARIAKTVAFIQTMKPAQIDGTEDNDIVIKRGDKETHYKGMQFLLGHALPNFYFHVTTAYNILRHNGVEIGKRDYLGNP